MAKYSLSQIQSLLRQTGWPESEIVRAGAIGIYESGGNTNAINDGSSTNSNEYSVGLYQINTKAHKYPIEQLKDPVFNATIALQLWRNRPNYGDWYNSNKKFNNNYQGIAAESRAVYAAGGANVIDTAQVNKAITETPNNNAIIVSGETDYVFYVGLALLGLVVLRR